MIFFCFTFFLSQFANINHSTLIFKAYLQSARTSKFKYITLGVLFIQGRLGRWQYSFSYGGSHCTCWIRWYPRSILNNTINMLIFRTVCCQLALSRVSNTNRNCNLLAMVCIQHAYLLREVLAIYIICIL